MSAIPAALLWFAFVANLITGAEPDRLTYLLVLGCFALVATARAIEQAVRS